MAIRVELFAAFAEFTGKKQLEIPYRPGITCLEIWKELSSRYPRIAAIPPLFAIEDEYVQKDKELQDGAGLMIFPPVSGGAPKFIHDEPLSVERSLEAIRDEYAGGEAIFIGRVRRISEGKRIRHLYYECRISMAEKEIARIIGEMQSGWPVRKIHIEHRIGKLEVGDVAVIVAVSSEHRKEAIEACRYGIDEIKHRAPIWKKEVSETGEVWVGACAEEHRQH